MKVKCPACKKEAEYTPENKYRPFCSERCSILDLGAWADEKYRVPVESQSDNEKDSVNENEDERSGIAASPPEFPSKGELN